MPELFKERLNLTKQLELYMPELFDARDACIHKYGCEDMLGDWDKLMDYLKEPQVNQQAAALIVKFAPDYILLKNSQPKQLYFIDIKHSVSPIWAPSRLKLIRDNNHDSSLTIDRIGVVAREALLSYRRFYPQSIILMASPYNPKVLMAQFAERVRCLYCYHDPARGDYDCNNCPSKSGGYFDIERAQNSTGSQTPMTNVDLDSFDPVQDFFSTIGISINSEVLEKMIDNIKQEPLFFENKAYPSLREKVIDSLRAAGCNWIGESNQKSENKYYSKPRNGYYHLDKDCYFLNRLNGKLEEYASVSEAKKAGKEFCRICCKD